MISPISARTHKDYKSYSINDAEVLLKFIDVLRKRAEAGCNTPYTLPVFLGHAVINQRQIKVLIDMAVTNKSEVNIPGNLIFWVYRSCATTNTKCPIELPHICKVKSPLGEKFFVTSRTDWAAHRDATVNLTKSVQISDHAKLQYLTRVLGMNIDELLSNFPTETLKTKGRLLGEGRYEHVVGDFLYIMDKNVCVTILNKSMVVI